jgi:hypothetical protein
MDEVSGQAPPVGFRWGSETMLAPQEVQKMLALSALGWRRASRCRTGAAEPSGVYPGPKGYPPHVWKAQRDVFLKLKRLK